MQHDFYKNQRKWIVWTPLLFSVVLVVGMFVGLRLGETGPGVQVIKANELSPNSLGNGKLEELIHYIDAKYVDPVNRNELIDDAVGEILSHLDPHSTYLSREEVMEEAERLEGNFDGIGVEFMVLRDTIRVVEAIPDGPSEAVGVLAGDKIVKVGDSIIVGEQLDTEKVVRMLRGAQDSQVEVGIIRGNEKELRTFTITRGRIPMKSVDVSYLIDPKTGYIRINRFSATTSTEFVQALKPMVEENGMEDLIIDLRQNPGGYLREATELLSQLFDRRDLLLVYTEGRNTQRQEYKSTGRAHFDIKDIVVLIDENSASASEILAGAVQDHDRGIIVGRRSFGKGLVQEQYQLRDGSAIRITVARYYTPSGRSIQKAYEDRESYSHELVDRQQNGELFYRDSIPLEDSTVYLTDHGREVFGGGGITPDVFVALDTIYRNLDFLKLQNQIPAFCFWQLQTWQTTYGELDMMEFVDTARPGEESWTEFLEFLRDEEFEIPVIQPNVKQKLQEEIKARVARLLYGREGLFVVYNEYDRDVQKARSLLENPNPISIISK
jgi:carboxyl-terminal processing protease